MKHSTKGEIGYHEIAKRLLKEGFTISKPDVDNGTDIIICDNGDCIQGQIKTIIFDEKKQKSCTVAGNKNMTFREKYGDMALIIVALDNDLSYLWSLTFAPGDVPDVKSFRLSRQLKVHSKYIHYKDAYRYLL